MNSLNATNESPQKRRVVAVRPAKLAVAKTATITHQALVRSFMFATVALAFSVLARLWRIAPMIVAITRKMTIPR